MWARFDDDVLAHPKLRCAGPFAGWLWFATVLHIRKWPQLNGIVCRSQVRGMVNWVAEVGADLAAQLGLDNDTLAEKLVTCGLFDRSGDGYAVHDHEVYGPTEAQMEKHKSTSERKKELARARTARWRKSKAGDAGDAAGDASRDAYGDGAVTSPKAPVPVPSTDPDPRRADPDLGSDPDPDLVLVPSQPRSGTSTPPQGAADMSRYEQFVDPDTGEHAAPGLWTPGAIRALAEELEGARLAAGPPAVLGRGDLDRTAAALAPSAALREDRPAPALVIGERLVQPGQNGRPGRPEPSEAPRARPGPPNGAGGPLAAPQPTESAPLADGGSPEIAQIAAELRRHPALKPVDPGPMAEALEGLRMDTGGPIQVVLGAIRDAAAEVGAKSAAREGLHAGQIASLLRRYVSADLRPGSKARKAHALPAEGGHRKVRVWQEREPE